jgi:LPS O-antigen subunit length determinant protein (WzzB/FepE family)
MPDLITVFAKRWKFIIVLTLAATLVALIAALLSPKKYLSTATALPANSLMADKARIFNNNIEALYSNFGASDELDRIEGTAALDTLYIATADSFKLAAHYEITPSGESDYKAAIRLKKNSDIIRSAYGELKIKVWDKDRNLAAALANTLLQKLQLLHQHLQNESNAVALARIKEDYALRQQQYKQLSDTAARLSGAEADIAAARKAALLEQMQQYEKLQDQYNLALTTNPQVLMTVERARPSLWPDKPRILTIVLLTFFIALVSAFLFSLFTESRNITSAYYRK